MLIGRSMHELTNLVDGICENGQVKVRYWSAPTTCPYLVGSENGTLKAYESIVEEDIGVRTGFALVIPADSRRFSMYCR